MDNDDRLKEYMQHNSELIEKIKRDNEERMAEIMGRVQSYTQSPYMKVDEPFDEVKFKETFDKAKALHDNGVAGDTEAVKKAYELLRKLNLQNPMNRLVEAYLGSTTALMGRDGSNPMEMMKLAKKGLKILDRAAGMDPQNISIRSLRGHVCYNLPEMYFMRTKCAINDFSYIISRYEKDSSCIDKGYYCQLLYNLGMANRTLGLKQDCEAAWNKLLRVTNDPKYRDLLEKAGFNASE